MKVKRLLAICSIILLTGGFSFSQELILPEGYPAYDVSFTEETSEGYLFLSVQPTVAKKSWLLVLDKFGTPVYYRYFDKVVTHFQLQPSGYLNFSEKIEIGSTTAIMDSAYNIIDRVPMLLGHKNDRHDFIHTSGGEFVLIGTDPTITDMSSIVEGGDPAALVKGGIVQVQSAQKEVLLDWNSRDYFEIADAYMDLTAPEIDNVHPNSLEIDLDGNILLISRSMNEITKIHRTTGEIIWRWGGKNNQFAFSSTDDHFSMPHDVRVLENGNYTLFDNGNMRDPQFSRAIEYSLNTDQMTVIKVWEYTADSMYYAPVKGSAQRLNNGNTLINYGPLSSPAVLEVKPDGNVAFVLNFADKGFSPRAVKHPWKTTLFSADKDSVDFGHWDGIKPITHDLSVKNESEKEIVITGYHLHTGAFGIEGNPFPLAVAPGEERYLRLWYSPDTIQDEQVMDILTVNSDINSDTLIQRIAIQVHLSGTLEPQGNTSVGPDQLPPALELFPNPSGGMITLRSQMEVNGQLSVYSLQGSLVYETPFKGSQKTLNLTSLEEGMYLLELRDYQSYKVFRRRFLLR